MLEGGEQQNKLKLYTPTPLRTDGFEVKSAYWS